MVKRFFRDSAIYVIPAALTNGLALITFPLYAHHFVPRQYGELDLLMLIGMLVGWTVALEIYQAIGRFVAGEKDVELARSYASTGFWYAVLSYALFLIATESFAVPISHLLLGRDTAVSLLRIALPLMCVQGMLSIVQAQLRWQLRPAAFAVGAILTAMTTLVASAVLVFGADLQVKGAILGQLLGVSVGLGYSLWATFGTFRREFDWQKCKEMISFSAPLVSSSVGVFLNLYADRLVIQHTRSLSDVGLYGVGYRLAQVVTLVLIGFQGAALPLILARKDDPSTPDDLARIFRIFSALGLAMFVILSIFATPAIRIMATARYQGATAVVPFLVISVLFANMYIFAPGLSIEKKTRVMAGTTVVAGVANVVLALLLVPPLGIVGAGIATASTSAGWFMALMVQSQRLYRAPHAWRQLTTAFVAVVTFVGVSLALLPSARDQALSPSTVSIRIALVITGVALSVRLAVDRDTLIRARGVLCSTAATVSRRARRAVGFAQ